MMILKGIDFGHVFCSSGARGFFGEGYWFHKAWQHFGLSYEGSTFVTKTVTEKPRIGNMPLSRNLQPLELFPRCIIVKPAAGVVLNSVGLSGPGAEWLLHAWTHERRPSETFVASFMPVESSPDARVAESRRFFTLFSEHEHLLPNLALQVNLSCPNARVNPLHLAEEASRIFDAAVSAKVKAPLLAKLSVLVTPRATALLALHHACAGLVVSNTVPWGELPSQIDWKDLFGSSVSPLAHLGGGGLSGAPLMPIVERWIQTAREVGVKKPIVGGGGILSTACADRLLDAGADAVELGSVSILRPWRVKKIIAHVNKRMGGQVQEYA
jgi:dihydroorotate dehydrogenase (NAD+) catalytic subunit